MILQTEPLLGVVPDNKILQEESQPFCTLFLFVWATPSNAQGHFSWCSGVIWSWEFNGKWKEGKQAPYPLYYLSNPLNLKLTIARPSLLPGCATPLGKPPSQGSQHLTLWVTLFTLSFSEFSELPMCSHYSLPIWLTPISQHWTLPTCPNRAVISWKGDLSPGG